MQEGILNIKSEKLFPFHFQLLGGIVLAAGLVAIIVIPLLGIVLAIIGFMTLTTYSGVQFDKNKKAYREYISLLFIKIGKFKSYDFVDKVYVNANQTTQKIYTRVNEGSEIKNIEYDAFIKLSNNEKLFLTSDKDKKKLLNKLDRISDFFRIEITDNTI